MTTTNVKSYPQKPGNPKPTTMYLISEGECEEIETVNENLPTDELEMKVRSILFDVRSRSELQLLNVLFPVNTKFYANGDLHCGWELDPKALFKLKKAIESNPQFTEEPEAEVIEVVVLAIKQVLRKGGFE